jgi:hypothetical protein
MMHERDFVDREVRELLLDIFLKIERIERRLEKLENPPVVMTPGKPTVKVTKE